MRLRRMLAVWAAKISEKASVHIFHRQGVTWAGKIALKIDPDILKELAGLDVSNMTPIQALNTLYELQKRLKETN